MDQYVSYAAQKFAPGNFVSTWTPELGRSAIGIVCGVEDPQEANPRILINWPYRQSTECELVRAEYLSLAKPEDFLNEIARLSHIEVVARKWSLEAAKHEAAAREIEEYSDRDEIDEEERVLNTSIAETLRQCVQDLMYPEPAKVAGEEIKF